MGRRKHNETPEEEGNWIYSYADMMSLLCCFFILLYKVTADEDKIKMISERIREALAGSDTPVSEKLEELEPDQRKIRAFEMLTTMLDLGDSVEDAVGNIERKFSDIKNSESFKRVFEEDLDESSRKQLEVLKRRNVDEDVLVTLIIPTDLAFASGAANLLDTATVKLADVASILRRMDGLAMVEIIGHTDDLPVRPGGSWQSNWDLSAARASTVGRFLQENGVDPQVMKVSGVAATRPLFPTEGAQGKTLREYRRKNRRIEIKIRRQRYQGETAQGTQELLHGTK